jgi:hypothetical protein
MSQHYYAPAQVTLYTSQGYWLDDACGLVWDVEDPKYPVYGYNDERFRRVARGHTIAYGKIAITFREPGWLHRFLGMTASNKGNEISRQRDRTSRSRFDRSIFKRAGVDTTYLNTSDPNDSTKTAAEVLLEKVLSDRNTLNQDLNAVKEGLKSSFWDRRGRNPQEDPGAANPLRLTGVEQNDSRHHVSKDYRRLNANLNIYVAYGPINETDSQHYILQDVHLTSKGQQISIETPADGEPIKEVYEFFCRDVQILIPRIPRESGENATVGALRSDDTAAG